MMSVTWTLWALQLSGIIMMEYGRLWFITVISLVVTTAMRMIYTRIQEKVVQFELEKCEYIENKDEIAMLLTLILKKIAIKLM